MKMAIGKILVEKFTVFDHMEFECSPGINVFIGENGTGKTQLMKFMYSLHETANDRYARLDSKLTGGIKDESEYLSNERFKFFMSCFHPMAFMDLLRCVPENLNGLRHVLRLPDKAQISLRMSDGIQHVLSMESLDNEGNPKCVITLFDSHNHSSVYIPAKEMVTHSQGLLAMSREYRKAMPFDSTLLKIIDIALKWEKDDTKDCLIKYIPLLEEIIGGKIIIESETFFVQKENGAKIDFAIEAEGIKKIGLLWLLLMNGSLEGGTVLFWDEPDANINPKIMPLIVDILLMLARNGIQIFVATHNYFMPKYFDVRKTAEDDILYHALYKSNDTIQVENENKFAFIENNPIVKQSIDLYKEEVKRVME
jgi:predicted ATP-dependent endonuclease of OLD family